MNNVTSAKKTKKAQTRKATSRKSSPWWEKGIRFQCQGSGQCCVSRGEYGFVYMTKMDRQRMASVLNMTTTAFTRKYCAKTDGVFHLKDGKGPECLFLVNNRCSVYEGRPEQCRTWPFWSEVMNAKAWKKEVANYCPGVNKGRLISAKEIRTQMERQIESERNLVLGK